MCGKLGTILYKFVNFIMGTTSNFQVPHTLPKSSFHEYPFPHKPDINIFRNHFHSNALPSILQLRMKWKPFKMNSTSNLALLEIIHIFFIKQKCSLKIYTYNETQRKGTLHIQIDVLYQIFIISLFVHIISCHHITTFTLYKQK